MKWFEDDTIKARLAQSEVRLEWSEYKAASHYYRICKKLPQALQSPQRIGALSFGAVEGADGSYCWMYPVDGSAAFGKILGENSRVKLLDKEGVVFFEGLWGDTTQALIESHTEFFIFLEPRHGRPDASELIKN